MLLLGFAKDLAELLGPAGSAWKGIHPGPEVRMRVATGENTEVIRRSLAIAEQNVHATG